MSLKNKIAMGLTKNIEKLINTKNEMIMRDYIENKLYYENEGYYSNISKCFNDYLPIGRLQMPLEFNKMRGISDYAKELNTKYPKSTWLTSSELLKPYFGYAVGNHILKNKKKGSNIKILEVGCGMGGAIDSILEFLKKFSIKDYKEVEYVGFEMTESMSQSTKELLINNHPELYKNEQITIFNNSLYDLDKQNNYDEEIFILGLNFVDSIGHDRVKFPNKIQNNLVSSYKDFVYNNDGKVGIKKFLEEFLKENNDFIQESHVVNLDGNLKEIYKPLEDHLVKEMLSYYFMPYEEKCQIIGQSFLEIEKARINSNEDWFLKVLKALFNIKGFGNNVWLPTNCIKFFETIKNRFPYHKLILMDFDFIPTKFFGCDYFGRNSPAVYSIKENSYDSITHKSIFDSYQTVGKPVNVYFPVDFDLLQLMYCIITRKNSSINKHKYFMKENSMDEWSETKSGFNPLLDTHHNLCFLLTI
jgi:hypothetical protein